MKNKKTTVKQSKNTESILSDQLMFCARLYRSYFAKNLLQYGLYPGQEHMLKALKKNNGQTIGELAKELKVRAPTITKMVTRMAAQELLTRLASKEDSRLSHVSITQKGLDLYEKVKQCKRQTRKQAFKKLNKLEKQQLNIALKKINSTLLEMG